jgi:hypothetical protein
MKIVSWAFDGSKWHAVDGQMSTACGLKAIRAVLSAQHPNTSNMTTCGDCHKVWRTTAAPKKP